MIRAENLTFAYASEPVLQAVNLEFHEGDFVGLVGPNGSGKSTLIKCLNGLYKPGEGTVSLDFKQLQNFDSRELAKQMAYVPQSFGRIMPVSVYDAVLLGRKPYISWRPGKNDHKIVLKVLKSLDLEDISMRNVTELSGGQKQRVFIARALAQNPRFIFLDEPTANLDLRHQIEVLNLLKRMAKDGIGIAISVHDLNTASRYCTKIVMLNQGKVFAQGGNEILTEGNICKLYGVDMKIIKQDNENYYIPKIKCDYDRN
ncbi:MAG: ABC transporter ATP-binding protein [Marinilabiliales bacterium]|nr:MAG: ABC transporter ATP-binding protein [Marinilabiliales bacterium]